MNNVQCQIPSYLSCSKEKHPVLRDGFTSGSLSSEQACQSYRRSSYKHAWEDGGQVHPHALECEWLLVKTPLHWINGVCFYTQLKWHGETEQKRVYQPWISSLKVQYFSLYFLRNRKALWFPKSSNWISVSCPYLSTTASMNSSIKSSYAWERSLFWYRPM